jgi:excisionase family DNA binding protein
VASRAGTALCAPVLTVPCMTTNSTTQTPSRFLTVDQVCEELQCDRSTLYKWWQKGTGPVRITLPNRTIRVRRERFEEFMTALEAAA